MSYKGRYQLGDIVPLTVWCRDGNLVPTLPDAAPIAVISSDTAMIAVFKLPIQDRFVTTGFFEHPLHLDARFAAGSYRVVYQYFLGGVAFGETDDFEVDQGGHVDGPGLAILYFRRPTSDFVLVQGDSGRIIRRRNPQL